MRRCLCHTFFTDTGHGDRVRKKGGTSVKYVFVTGGVVSVVSKVREDLIVNVKNTRVAISKEAALKIMV